MIIIGITGGIGHGKSSLAEAFRQIEPRSVHLESSSLIAEVIDEWQARTGSAPNPHDFEAVNSWVSILPTILEQHTHTKIDAAAFRFDPDDLVANPVLYEKLFMYLQAVQKHPILMRMRITDANKSDYRPLLQWLGGYVAIRCGAKLWFSELMRRAQAADMLLCTVGGVRFPGDADVIHEHKGFVALVKRPLMGNADVSDPTERERHKVVVDTTVINNGNLADLEAAARHIYTDIRVGKLRVHYAATDPH